MARCEICGKTLSDEVFQVWWLTSTAVSGVSSGGCGCLSSAAGRQAD